LEFVAVFSCIVLLWAFVRPSTVRDDDNRRLPRNLTAPFAMLPFAVTVGICLLARLPS
jgi:hypothetical protein